MPSTVQPTPVIRPVFIYGRRIPPRDVVPVAVLAARYSILAVN